MESVEAKALKTSLWPETTLKSNQEQVVIGQEDLCYENSNNNGTPNNGVSGGDETFLDDLFDFSNEDVIKETGVYVKEEEEEDYENNDEDKDNNFFSSSSSQKNNNSTLLSSSGASFKNDFASVFSSELSVPTDDLADLEWLSHFVEDSFSEEFSHQYHDGNPAVLMKPQIGNQNRTEPKPETPSLKSMGFSSSTTVPAKARSKRSRTGGRIWSLGYSSLTETSSSTSSSSSSLSSSSSCLIFNSSPVQTLDYFDCLGKPPIKQKQKKKRQPSGAKNGGNRTVSQQRCTHCGVQKTPQWRTGPVGAKTLCNACGVRYKSGRLLPEYRPAGSPTFSSDVHSNSHRKVLEMRRKKEIASPEPGLTPAVHSF